VNARVPIYEGDGLLRDALARAAAPAPTGRERPATESLEPPHAEIAEIERLARQMRADAIADFFAGVFRWLDRVLWRAQQRDVEHYLSQATDAADLERRMRTLERARPSALGSYR
jgi:hypothetical protein